MDTLFGGQNHVEKGGDLLQVENAHHAHIGDKRERSDIEPATDHYVAEIKV